MQPDFSAYEVAKDHAASLSQLVERVRVLLELYARSDHNEDRWNTETMHEIREELGALNARVEQIIQRLDPHYESRFF